MTSRTRGGVGVGQNVTMDCVNETVKGRGGGNKCGNLLDAINGCECVQYRYNV